MTMTIPNAESRLLWCAAMRERLDQKSLNEWPLVRAWFSTVDGIPERRHALALAGHRDMADWLELASFLHYRIYWIESVAFRAIGLFDGEPIKPDRSPTVARLTVETAARLWGDRWDDDLTILFAGNSKPQTTRRHRAKATTTG